MIPIPDTENTYTLEKALTELLTNGNLFVKSSWTQYLKCQKMCELQCVGDISDPVVFCS